MQERNSKMNSRNPPTAENRVAHSQLWIVAHYTPQDAVAELLDSVGPNTIAPIRELKKRLFRNALSEANGSYTEAAKLLGVHPNYLHRLIRNLEVRAELRERESEQEHLTQSAIKLANYARQAAPGAKFSHRSPSRGARWCPSQTLRAHQRQRCPAHLHPSRDND
jgi:hypothetical protein